MKNKTIFYFVFAIINYLCSALLFLHIYSVFEYNHQYLNEDILICFICGVICFIFGNIYVIAAIIRKLKYKNRN